MTLTRWRRAGRRGLPGRQGGIVHVLLRRLDMKRVAIAFVLIAATLPLTACFGGGGSKSSKKATAKHPVTLTVWVGWSASTHELAVFKRLVSEYDKNHPEVRVKVVGDIVDNKIL